MGTQTGSKALIICKAMNIVSVSARWNEGIDVKIIIFFIGAVLSSVVFADNTRYITDQLEITLRSGESTKHQILKMLRSGTAVEVLETNSETGYSRIRTPNGSEGWVITRYLDKISSARARLSNAEKKLASLKASNRQFNSDVSSLSKEKGGLNTQIKKLTKENKTLSQNLTSIKKTSASALAIDNENKTLKRKLRKLEADYQLTQEENTVLRDRTAKDWFMVGAGVILLGIGIGLLIPKIRWRKKSNWSSL